MVTLLIIGYKLLDILEYPMFLNDILPDASTLSWLVPDVLNILSPHTQGKKE